MIETKYYIQIYSNKKGREPFTQWLESLENIEIQNKSTQQKDILKAKEYFEDYNNRKAEIINEKI